MTLRPETRRLWARLRVTVLGLGVGLGMALNLTVAPQIMTPRQPVFNGPDIAENWEWRSMAIGMHSWWLWENFPRARVTNVGYVTPPAFPDGLPVGMKFSDWVDETLGLSVDLTEPPLDLRSENLESLTGEYRQLRSRIDCRVGQAMVKSDTCYYFVAFDRQTVTESSVFVGVLTSSEPGSEEFGLVESRLLEELLPGGLGSVSVMEDAGPL